MKWSGYTKRHLGVIAVGCAFVVGFGCGDGGTGSDDEQTGATLRGQIVQFEGLAAKESAPAGDPLFLAMAPTNDVDVSIGNKKTTTDANGFFLVNDIPLGDNVIMFSGSGISEDYFLGGIEVGTTVQMDSVKIKGGQVKTKHTGTWVGTAGSTEPGSQGQVIFTLVIAANGNSLSGTGTVAPPDNSVWSMSGKETGLTVEGEMTLVSTNSSCATGAGISGTFSADTLFGTFVESDSIAGCGSPESGTFRVVKQQQ